MSFNDKENVNSKINIRGKVFNYIILVISLLTVIMAIYSSVIVIKYSNQTDEYDNIDVIDLELRESNEYEYESLKTVEFTLYRSSTNDSEINIDNGSIDLVDMANTINKYLDSTPNQVVEMKLIGNKLYILEDSTKKKEVDQKINIVSLSSEIGQNDMVKAIEKINYENNVAASFIFNINSEYGKIHYVYIYNVKE